MYYPGVFICSMGNLGSGKTMNATRWLYKAYQAGYSCVTNYDTAFSQRLTSLESLQETQNSMVVLDELQTMLDSRSFSKNAELTEWFTLVRKLGIRLHYTAQHVQMVDIRIRQLTSFIFYCQRLTHGYSRVTLYAYDGFSARKRGTMILNWKQLGPLYDTKDMVVQLRQGGVGIPTKKDQKLLGDSQAGLSDKKTASKREQLAVSILETGLSMIGQDDRKKRVNDYNKLVELLNTYKDTKEGT